jgi:hypothetical protein
MFPPQPGGRLDHPTDQSRSLKAKCALAARLKRSPDLLDALLMTFTFL